MTDIFFSYSSADRERVRPVRDALVAQGFEVFWDQEVPSGLDWDSWFRQHLAKCKCAMAFWSAASVASDNVRHEAVVAKQQGKLISVLLESLTAQQFPMGLYAQQAANLADWNGDLNHKEWRKLRREYEAKLIPTWVRQQLDELEAELVGERARRDGVERRDKTLQAQIAKEAQAHQDLKREFDKSLDEVATAKANLVELSQRLDEANAQISASARRIEVAKSAARAALFTQNPIMQFGSIAAVVATIGFWTYHLIWSAPPASQQGSVQEAALLPVAVTDEVRRKIEEAEQFKKEAERQANLAADADTKRQSAEKLAADADSKRKVAEDGQQRLKLEVQRLSTAAADADSKRQAAEKLAADADAKRKIVEDEQQRLAAALRAARQLQAPSAPAGAKAPFEIKLNMEARGDPRDSYLGSVTSINECQLKCAQSDKCTTFSFNKGNKTCYSYSNAQLVPNSTYDSGIRQSPQTSIQSGTPQPPAQQAATLPAANQPASTRATGLFTIHINTEVGHNVGAEYSADAESMDDCEKMCTARSRCKLFSYNKMTKKCYQYFSAGLTPNPQFDSGVRK